MQHNVDAIWRLVRGDVLQTEFQPASREIYDQRPFEIAVAISSHDGDSGPEWPKLVENRFGADVPQVPNFIGAFSHFTHSLRQTIVRVREHENAPDLLRGLVEVRHV
jgi:hypothetical protein